MSRARDRGRSVPLRWGGSLAVAGLCLALAGGYLEYSDRAGAAPPAAAETRAPAPRQPPSATGTTKPSSTGTSKPPSAEGTKKPVVLSPRPGRPQRISVPHLGVSA